mgnify:CR=1 FL=1
MSFSLQSSPLAVSPFNIPLNLLLQLCPTILLKFPKHSCRGSDKLVVKRLVFRFVGVGKSIPPLVFVYKILKAILNSLPQAENSLRAFLPVNNLAVLLTKHLALLTVLRILRLCKEEAAAQLALNTEHLSDNDALQCSDNKGRLFHGSR